MLSYVNFLQPHVLFISEGEYYTITDYRYKGIDIAIAHHKKKSMEYGSYFMEIQYVSTNQ